MEKLEKRLKDFYKEHYCDILKKEDYEECKMKCGNFKYCEKKASKKFAYSMNVLVGKNYGNGIPRLLFLSSDCPYEGLSKLIWYGKEKDEGGNTHWKQTMRVANLILYGKDKLKKDSTVFAHTNSCKCTDNQKGGKQGDKSKFDNCRNIVRCEIPLYEADIIVTQGKMAKTVMDIFIKEKDVPLLNEDLEYGKKDKKGKRKKTNLLIYKINIENKDVLYIAMNHPCATGQHSAQRKRLKVFRDDNTNFFSQIIFKNDTFCRPVVVPLPKI
jgi:hypothetical protein